MKKQDFISKLTAIQGRMLGYALKLTHNMDDANDLRQETTLNALLHENSYVEKSSFTAWVLQIMKNRFINDYNKILRDKSLAENLSIEELYQLYSIPTIYSVLSRDEILKMVSTLDDIYRIPFLMQYNGYKYHEIAEELDIPMGTVKRRINEARKQLKDIYIKNNR